jgi:hypothetical protein
VARCASVIGSLRERHLLAPLVSLVRFAHVSGSLRERQWFNPMADFL